MQRAKPYLQQAMLRVPSHHNVQRLPSSNHCFQQRTARTPRTLPHKKRAKERCTGGGGNFLLACGITLGCITLQCAKTNFKQALLPRTQCPANHTSAPASRPPANCVAMTMDTQWTLNGHYNGHSMDTGKNHMFRARVLKQLNEIKGSLLAREQIMWFLPVSIECPL